MTTPLWNPGDGRIASAQITRFMADIEAQHGVTLRGDYFALHAWALANPEAFWAAVWDFCGVIGKPGQTVVEDFDPVRH